MDPSEAVAAAESSLRDAIRLVLPTWSQAPGAPDRSSLDRKKEEDSKRRDGTLVDSDLLAYSEVHQLATLIEKNWQQFAPVFGDLARTKVFLRALLDYRNPVAHSRELVTFERELLSGISGQLRNQVALYRTANEPSSAHYPVIEAVSDGFGQNLTSSEFLPIGQVALRLDVGQRLEFRCRAWDVQERRLTWDFGASRLRTSANVPLLSLSGNPIDFSVPITEEWVGEGIHVTIYVRTNGRHHRHDYGPWMSGVFDDVRFGTYAVNPPNVPS
jgi:hypothetical protein